MTLTTLIIAGVVFLLVVLTIIGLLSRYRKCPSAQVAKSFVENFTPALDMINSGFKDKFKELFKSGEKKELPGENFEEVK